MTTQGGHAPAATMVAAAAKPHRRQPSDADLNTGHHWVPNEVSHARSRRQRSGAHAARPCITHDSGGMHACVRRSSRRCSGQQATRPMGKGTSTDEEASRLLGLRTYQTHGRSKNTAPAEQKQCTHKHGASGLLLYCWCHFFLFKLDRPNRPQGSSSSKACSSSKAVAAAAGSSKEGRSNKAIAG